MQHNQIPQRVMPSILDILTAISLFLFSCFYGYLLIVSKGQDVNLDFGWSLTGSLYFTILFLVRYYFLPKDEKGNISVLTIISAITAVVFWTAVFK